ncbi:MAG TPA: hypothetical protein VF824_03625 [Thermoanaerobaculia bacterium]|jgi:opacity protein-like surface antigen
MKSSRFLPILAVVLLAAPAVFAADFGVRAGRYNDGEDTFVGAEAAFDLGRFSLVPNVEYDVDSDVTAGSANLDVTLDIAKISRFTPYVGAGVGLAYVDTDFGDNTETLGNLIGGVRFDLDFLKPYAQIKYFRSLENNGGDNDDLALTVGLRF